MYSCTLLKKGSKKLGDSSLDAYNQNVHMHTVLYVSTYACIERSTHDAKIKMVTCVSKYGESRMGGEHFYAYQLR